MNWFLGWAGGRVTGWYVRNRTSPKFQRKFFGWFMAVCIVIGSFLVLAGSQLLADPDTKTDPDPWLMGLGALLVLFGLWVGVRDFRRIHLLEQEIERANQQYINEVVDLQEHLEQQHSWRGTTDLDQDRLTHIQCHQSGRVPVPHRHTWQDQLPGPIDNQWRPPPPQGGGTSTSSNTWRAQ